MRPERQQLKLVGFWWGNGRGKYDPFVNQFLKWKHEYADPSGRFNIEGIFDATGTQSGFETMFAILKQEMITGINLTVTNKYPGLTALKLLMENRKFAWPREIKGISYQLGNYELPDTDIDQDIVSVLIMTALWARRYWRGPEMEEGKEERFNDDAPVVERHARPRGPRYIDRHRR
jgi:hypothetical protein